MTQTEFTNKLLAVFEEAMLNPDDYINPNYIGLLVETIESYTGDEPEVYNKTDKVHDYITEMYGM